jgi:hypothetical protein
MVASESACCLHCVHFRNSPAYLESAYKGLTAFGSAYASVRGDDGICLLKDLYLSADAWCEAFEKRAEYSPQPIGTRI